MANVATLGAKATFDVSGFMSGVNAMTKGVQSASQSMRDASFAGAAFGVGLGGITAAISGVRSGLSALSNTLTWGVNLAMEAEKAEVGFRVLLGGAKEAKDMMKDIENFALKTPLDQSGVTKNVLALKGAGIATKEILPLMKTLGDLAMGDNEKLTLMATNYSQIMSKGRLQTQDFNQFATVGLGKPIQDLIEKNLNIPMGKFRDWMEEGKISATSLHNALVDLAEGPFKGFIEEMGKTTGGMLDKIKEKIGLISKDFVVGFMGGDSTKTFLENIDSTLDKFRNDTVPGLIVGLKSIVAEMGAMKDALLSFANVAGDNYWIKLFNNVGKSAGGVVEQQRRLDKIREMKKSGASEDDIDRMLGVSRAANGNFKFDKNIANKFAQGDNGGALLGAEKKAVMQPGNQALFNVMKQQSKQLGYETGFGIGQALSSIGRFIGMGAGLAGAGLAAVTPGKSHEYRPTGALVAGSSEAYSAQIRNMFGDKKTTIEEKQLEKLDVIAKGIMKMASEAINKGSGSLATIESFLAGVGGAK